MASSAGVGNLLKVGTKIVAVGRNYVAHAKELGNPVPKEPVLFLKPTSSYVTDGGTIEVPHPLESLHHEVELVVVIGRKAWDVVESAAMDHVAVFFFGPLMMSTALGFNGGLCCCIGYDCKGNPSLCKGCRSTLDCSERAGYFHTHQLCSGQISSARP